MESNELLDFIVAKIKQLQKEQNLPLVRMAEIMGCKTETIYRWFRKKNAPQVYLLYKLARYHGVPVSYFFPAAESSPTPPDELALVKQVTKDATKVVQKTMGAIVRLPATEKHILLNLLDKPSESLVAVLEIAGSLSKMNLGRLHKIRDVVVVDSI